MCPQQYRSWNVSDPDAQDVSINSPTAAYVIRVRQDEPTENQDRIRKFNITLESVGTGKVLASTDLLKSYYSSPCQDYAKETAALLTRSFSK